MLFRKGCHYSDHCLILENGDDLKYAHVHSKKSYNEAIL